MNAQSLTDGDWVTHSSEQTFDLGARIGERLTGGEILLLDGPLGAGKTVFVKGVAAGLGVAEDEVTSPSFTLVNAYTDGRLRLYHLDLYRLNEERRITQTVGLDEMLSDETAVIIIEWAGRLKNYPLPQSSVWNVSVTGDGDAPRRLILSKTS
jgi:tRNA threonylcarbamoyladenosine biosynthesis protein TsaE